MATAPTRSVAPDRPIPQLPIGASSNGDNAQPLNEVLLKQTKDTVVSNINAVNNAAGIPTINISANTSPEELKASAAKAKAALGLPSVTSQSAEKGAQALPIASSKGPAPIPTFKVEDVDAPKAEANGAHALATPPSEAGSGAPGDFPTAKAPVIPDWYKIGWRAVSGVDHPLPEGVEKDKGILMAFVNEQYYGDWYHNAAVIIVAVVFTHLMTLLRMGWGWILILLAFCCTYYSTSMERFRRRARDDMQRELTKTRLINETETADWMNNFLSRFWLIYEDVLCKTIVASVSQILSASTPAFLDSLALTTFSLGTKAPHIDHVRTYPDTKDDEVVMEWGVSFTPNDVLDMTYRQAQNKQNPKIVLEIRIGKGVTAAIPVLLEDITFKGTMKIKLKLITSFPHISIVDICFTEPPWIDYVLKPIGGETFGFDIASIPGLSSFIRDTMHSVLGPMMYEPNVFTLNLEQLMSGVPLDTAIGVLQVTVISASGIKANKMGGGNPDPYVSIAINNNTVLDQTKWKESTRAPVWNETKFVLVSSLSGTLNLTVWDYNEHRKDNDLGTVTWNLTQLENETSYEGIVQKVLLDAKDRGELKFDVAFFPVLKPEIVDGTPEPVPETSVGVVRLVIHQAKELDASKNTISKDINSFVKVYTGKDFIHSTPVMKHSLTPIWESPKEFLCSDRESCVITLNVIDDREFMKDPIIGTFTANLDELLKAKQEGRDWFPLTGCNSGRIRISTEWKPVNMAGSLYGAAKYVPPIGVVKILMKKAVDVKNVEGGLGGKSDPYVRVMIDNMIKARTEVMNNNLNPVWDQYMYIPVHTLRETLYIECMDYQNLSKDRSLGHVELDVKTLAKEAADKHEYLFESTGSVDLVEKIKVDNTFKGELHFSAEFFPALHLAGVSFTEVPNAIDKAVAKGQAETGAEVPGGVTKKDEPAVASTNGEAAKPPSNGDTTSVLGSIGGESVKLTKEQVMASPAGVIVFDVVSGHLAKKGRLEILMDDGYWPVFSTSKSGATSVTWDMVGEGFIKELDFGRVWLRLNTHDDSEKEEIIAELKQDAKLFLERALDGPTEFMLTDVHGEHQTTVVIAAKFVPVPIKLTARESVNNQGHLRVEIIDGKDLHAADRSGTSDPYAIITLGGEKVHKTDTKKKTLAPVWSENFECTVMSREDADMSVEVFDWDQIGKNTALGKGSIDLAALEPFTPSEITVPLRSSKMGDKGQVRLRLLFTPEIITRSRKSTSTFSVAGRTATQIGTAPVAIGKGVVGGVAGGVGIVGKGAVGGVTGVGKGVKGIFGGKKTHGVEDHDASQLQAVTGGATNASGQPVIQEPAAAAAAATAAAGGAVTGGLGGLGGALGGAASSVAPMTYGYNVDPHSFPQQSSASVNTATAAGGGDSSEGTLRVIVQNGRNLVDSDGDQVRPYVVVNLGSKEFKTKHGAKTNAPDWDESFTFTVGPNTKTLHLEVLEYKTIGRDRSMGQIDIPIWQHLQPNANSSVTTANVTSELEKGSGQISIRLEFEQGNSSGLSVRSGSIGSMDRPGIGSPSRFSMRKAKSPFAE